MKKTFVISFSDDSADWIKKASKRPYKKQSLKKTTKPTTKK